MFEEFINTYGLEIIGLLLTTVLGALGMVVRRLAQRWLDTQEKQSIARVAVQFVEQCFQELHGRDKLEKALETASALLQEKGIKFGVHEMQILIEAAVQEFNRAVKPPLMDQATAEAIRKHYDYYTPEKNN